MPVFRQTYTSSQDYSELVDAIAAELRQESCTAGGPVIYEDEVPQARALNVIVIWDRWHDVPESARGPIIVEAYERVQPNAASKPRHALGLTYEEAMSAGYLPYVVTALLPPHVSPDEKMEIVKAMLGEGARAQLGSGISLRFPYLRLAEQSAQRLRQRFGDLFQVGEDLGAVGHWVQSPRTGR